jgi:general secretion pathway protein J
MSKFPSPLSQQDGFSLVEMLVAVFLLSVVSIISLSIMSNFADANQMVTAKMSDLAQIERARNFLRADLRETVERGFFVQDQKLDQNDLLFRLTRGDAENAKVDDAYSPVEMVEYRINNDKLIRRSYLRPEAIEITPFRDYVLLENVGDISLKFYDGFLWHNYWVNIQNSNTVLLPRALELSWSSHDGQDYNGASFNIRFAVGSPI